MKMMDNCAAKDAEYYESLDLCKVADLSQARIGQKGAINCFIERITSTVNEALSFPKYPTTALELPTRYGKSDVIRICILEAIMRGR